MGFVLEDAANQARRQARAPPLGAGIGPCDPPAMARANPRENTIPRSKKFAADIRRSAIAPLKKSSAGTNRERNA
jgi:hypothetical protein